MNVLDLLFIFGCGDGYFINNWFIEISGCDFGDFGVFFECFVVF